MKRICEIHKQEECLPCFGDRGFSQDRRFTDDDLKRLKEMVVTWQFSAEAIGNYLRAHEGIFARLEAARK